MIQSYTALVSLWIALAPPVPLPPPVGVVQAHLARVQARIAAARTSDERGRRYLREARISLAGAESAASAHDFVTADELAASADDLLRASDGLPPPPMPPAEDVLARVGAIDSALSAVANARVRALIADADGLAADARRRDVAGDVRTATTEALRAEAIARAAAHVAIAADPTLAPALPRPKPPGPPPRPPETAHP